MATLLPLQVMSGNRPKTYLLTKNIREPISFRSTTRNKLHKCCQSILPIGNPSMGNGLSIGAKPPTSALKISIKRITIPQNGTPFPYRLIWNVYGIQKDGSLKYGLPIYVNQPVIFYHERKVDDWRKGVMRTPPTDWTTYEYRNEVGSYVREFEVPNNWEGREIFIDFDGVDSFFYLWINGKYVGFSKNSRNVASFDITPYLQKGKIKVAVEVYRNSDGSFLESQDMFRLPGIFRTVALRATPQSPNPSI